MRQIVLTLILALGCLVETVQAQDAKAAIRQHYAAAKAYVEQQQQVEAGGDIYPVTQCFSVQVKQNLPGTGYHQEDVKLYYREEQDSDEQIYPDKDCELRFYFNKGELIETIVKSRPMDGGTFETVYQGKTVPAAYSDSYESRLSAAKGIMELFKAINANREL